MSVWLFRHILRTGDIFILVLSYNALFVDLTTILVIPSVFLISWSAPVFCIKWFYIDGLVSIPLTEVFKPRLPLIVLFLLICFEFVGVTFNLIDEIIAFLLLHLKMQTFSCILTFDIIELTFKLIIGFIKFILEVGNIIRPTHQRMIH
jgi:hypothetical protein